MSSNPVLEARGLAKTFATGGRTLEILKDLDLVVAPGEVVSIEGASGVGKSTLLHLLGLLDRPTGGQILYEGRRVDDASLADKARIRREGIGFVFQLYHLLPELTALQNVLLTHWIGGTPGDWLEQRGQWRDEAREILGRIGLGDRIDHFPAQLSGGERQRVAIARAVAGHPRVLLCDEPTGNLDPRTAEEIAELLGDLNRERSIALVIVTHNPEVAARAPRRLCLTEGRLVAAGDGVRSPGRKPTPGVPGGET